MLFIIVASLGAVPIVANIVCFQCLPPAGLTVTTIGQFLSLHKIAVDNSQLGPMAQIGRCFYYLDVDPSIYLVYVMYPWMIP